MKKIIFRLLALLLVLAAGYGGYSLYRQFEEKKQEIATTKVRQGDVIIRSYARGELRAVRSAMLIAPNLFGTVQITRLAPLGSFAKEKDLVVEFDDADVQSRLEERSLELEQLDEQIKSQQADLAIRNNEDQVELLRARYSVRRSELEVQRNELLSAINAKTNILNQEEAKRRLKQLESDIKSRQEQARAQLAVLQERRNRAVIEMNRERQRLMQVKLLAPMSGLVAIKQSRPMGGIFFRGMQLPDVREGDQVFPGTPIADVLDLSEMEVAAKVNEIDRAGLHEGQDVIIRLDAVAEKQFHGTIKSLSGTASANIFSNDPAKKFDVVFAVDMKELMTGLGARPEQIKKVLEMAEQNRKRPATGPSAAQMAIARLNEGGGMPGGQGGMQMMQMGAPAAGGMSGAAGGAREGERQRGEGGAREGGGGRGGSFADRMIAMLGSQLSEADQKKVKAAFEKALAGKNLREMSQEERQKVFAELQKAMPKGVQLPMFGQRPGGAGGPGAPGGMPGMAPGGMRGGFPGAGQGGPGGMPMMAMPSLIPGGFTPKDLENAKLPAPPEENNELDVLLRPGLLADVQIIVEKVPNAINVPAQAVFEKDGKPVVYVKTGANRFEPRVIKPLKQSESVMVISDGVKPGEVIALSNPERGEKKGSKDAGKKPGGGGLPGGGAGAGSQGGR